MAGTVVGVDIGAAAVRAVEVQGYDGGRPSITRYHELPLPESSVRRSEVVEIGTVTTALRRLWSAGGFKAKDVVLGIGGQRVFARDMSVPRQPIHQIRESLPFLVQDQLPVPVSDVLMDFYPIHEEHGEQGPVVNGLLVAGLKETIDASVNAALSAGLRPVHVDLIPFAISRAIAPVRSARGRDVIVSIGANTTNVVIVEDGVPQFVRILPNGGEDVTRALASRMQWSPEQAEHAKRSLGMGTAMMRQEDRPVVEIIYEVVGELLDQHPEHPQLFRHRTSSGRDSTDHAQRWRRAVDRPSERARGFDEIAGRHRRTLGESLDATSPRSEPPDERATRRVHDGVRPRAREPRMSAVTPARDSSGAKVMLGGEPRVQLLPPIVGQREKAKASRRMAVLLVLLSFAIAGGLFVYGFFRVAAAQLALAQANRTTEELIVQQGEYRIATDIATAVSQAQEAQRVTTSYEISWAPLLAQIQSFLEPEAELMSIEVVNQAPWAEALAVEDPLRTPRIATIALTVNSTTFAGPLYLSQRLSAIPGYADSVIESIVVGTDGMTTTKISLTLSTGAVSGRYVGNDHRASGEDDRMQRRRTTSPRSPKRRTEMRALGRIWLAGGALIAVIVVAFGWFMLAMPQLDQAAKADLQRASVQAQNDQLQAVLTTMKGQYENLDALQEQLEELHLSVPGTRDLDPYFLKVALAANLAGVALNGVEVGVAQPYFIPTAGAPSTPAPTDTASAEGESTPQPVRRRPGPRPLSSRLSPLR